MTREDHYRTRSLNIASFFCSTGKVKLFHLDKTNPEEIWFVFNDKSLCEELEQDYWQDRALSNPKKLFQAQNELKDQMFN